MHILILVGEYQPEASPNGLIAELLADEFKENHTVTVLSRRNRFDLQTVSSINGIKIIRVDDVALMLNHFLTTAIYRHHGLRKTIDQYVLFIKRLWFWIPRAFRSSSVSRYFCGKIIHAIDKIDQEHPVDVLIPVSAPHEEVIAAMLWNKVHYRKLLPYQLDRFVHAKSLYPLKLTKQWQRQNNIQLEKQVLDSSNCLFFLKPLSSYYTQARFKSWSGKLVYTEHPLVREIVVHTGVVHSHVGITLVYAGSFDMQLRNPIHLCKVFLNKAIMESPLYLHLYCFGNCHAILEKYEKKAAGHIVYHGKVASNVMPEVLSGSDILVSVGNDSDEEVPSKLFDYLSYGKPIVHFYFSDKDPYLEYLRRYPLALCLKISESNVCSNAALLADFSYRHLGDQVPAEIIFSLYEDCTPRYVASLFELQMAVEGI